MLLLAAVLLAAPPAPPVTAAAWSPDGTLLAAGTRGTAQLFDAAGEPLADLPGQTGRVTAVAFGPKLLAVAGGEPGRSGVVRLYHLADPARPTPLGGPLAAHKDLVYALAVSPDGRTLATAGYDRTVKLWDVPPGPSPRHTLTDHSDAVYAVAFHPTGRLLATAAADRTVKVWEVATGRRLYTLGEPTDAVFAVAWHPDGKHLLAAGADKSLRVWAASADGGSLVRTAFAHDRPIHRLAFTAAGDTVWSVADDRTVKAFDPLTLAEKKSLPPATDDVLAFAVSPDGKRAAVGRFDGTLALIALDTGKAVAGLLPAKPRPPVVAVAIPDAVVRGKRVTVTLRGRWLAGVTGAVADSPGVEVSVVGKPAADGLTLRVVADDSAAVGPVAVRLRSPAGDSAPVRLWVDHFPVVAEANAPDAQPVRLPASLVGRLDRTGNADAFRFRAGRGQEVGLVLTPAEPGGLDAAFRVADAAGRVLAESADHRLGFTAPADGVYTVTVRDRRYRGGPKLGYRLHVGDLPVVTGVFPLGIPRGTAAEVSLVGVNLPTRKPVRLSVPADAEPGGRVPVPGTDAAVVAGEFPAVRVEGGTATVPVPGTADGRLARPGESHTVHFAGKKDHPLVIEVHAARLGSPLDSVIEVLDAAGRPVPRAVLRGVAKASTTLRDHPATTPGVRLDAWPGFAVDDYVLAGTELMRIKAMPPGPDDDCQFYQAEGKRLGFLGTTPTAHAFGTDVYKVAVEPPGSTVRPNGLPAVTLPYRNDDGGPGFGADSWLLFTPPADGEYRVRVGDAHGGGGERYAYRLTVREPRPGFAVRLAPPKKLPKGGAGTVTVTATRIDGFEGPIRLTAEGLPPAVIEANQFEAVVPLAAGEGLPAELRLTAAADIAGRPVRHTASVTLPKPSDPADVTIATDRPSVVVPHGGAARLKLKITRLPGFAGRVPVEVRGLPHGVRVENVGLNGVLLQPGATVREIVLAAEPWVRVADWPVAVVARSERSGAEFGVPVTLTVK